MIRKSPGHRYVVRLLPWKSGERRMQLGKARYYAEAQRLAARGSAGARQCAIECLGVPIALWLNGVEVQAAAEAGL